jgi:hypothetical protein
MKQERRGQRNQKSPTGRAEGSLGARRLVKEQASSEDGWVGAVEGDELGRARKVRSSL